MVPLAVIVWVKPNGRCPSWAPALCTRACRNEEESKPRAQPSDNHLPRPTIDMDLQDSFSRLKKKLKHPPTGGRRKLERMGADVVGEGADREGSLPRSELHPDVEDTEKAGPIHPYLPPHPLLQSRTVKNLTVCERDYFSCNI